MSLYSLPYFNASHIEERTRATIQDGTFIDNKSYGNNWIQLYAYSNYVIELHYDSDQNSILDAKAITLDEYCDKWGIELEY